MHRRAAETHQRGVDAAAKDVEHVLVTWLAGRPPHRTGRRGRSSPHGLGVASALTTSIWSPTAGADRCRRVVRIYCVHSGGRNDDRQGNQLPDHGCREVALFDGADDMRREAELVERLDIVGDAQPLLAGGDQRGVDRLRQPPFRALLRDGDRLGPDVTSHDQTGLSLQSRVGMLRVSGTDPLLRRPCEWSPAEEGLSCSCASAGTP